MFNCIVCEECVSPDYIPLCDDCTKHAYEQIDTVEVYFTADELYSPITKEDEQAELEILWYESCNNWNETYREALSADYDGYEEVDYFDLYDHFGIPSDLSDWQQEALLEAAMGSS
jgi:hypothetical protein